MILPVIVLGEVLLELIKHNHRFTKSSEEVTESGGCCG